MFINVNMAYITDIMSMSNETKTQLRIVGEELEHFLMETRLY